MNKRHALLAAAVATLSLAGAAQAATVESIPDVNVVKVGGGDCYSRLTDKDSDGRPTAHSCAGQPLAHSCAGSND